MDAEIQLSQHGPLVACALHPSPRSQRRIPWREGEIPCLTPHAGKQGALDGSRPLQASRKGPSGWGHNPARHAPCGLARRATIHYRRRTLAARER